MTFVVNEHYFHIRRMAVERNPRSRRMFLLEKECRVLNAKRSSVTRLSWTGLLFNLNTTLRLLAFPPLKTTAIWTKTALLCRHFEDLHQPGEFPCPGDERICGKVFTSRNKMSSHYSRYQGSWNKKNSEYFELNSISGIATQTTQLGHKPLQGGELLWAWNSDFCRKTWYLEPLDH